MIKKILDGKIVLTLIILSPLIDIITSVMSYNGLDLTLGLFTKVIVLLFASLYLLFIDKNNKKYNYLLIGGLLIHNILHIANNINVLNEHAFSYLGYLIKFDFIIVMLLFFIKYFKENKFNIKTLKIPIIIICLSLVISNITGTAFYTYDVVRSGTSSWFQSANEFGALLSILYPITIYLCIDRKYSRKIEIIYVIIIAYGLLEIGTKVGLLSFYISSITYIIARLINMKNHKLNYAFYSVILLLLISICCFSNLPAIKNIKYRYDTTGSATEVITSGRDRYLKYIKNNNYDNFDYIIGKANIKDNEILLIELDMYDMFYMFGAVGFIIIYGTILFVVVKIISKYKENLLSGLKYTKINMLVVCLGVAFLISLTAGHVVLCPSVSIYAALICGYLAAYDKFEKAENDKKKILIGSVHAQIGGIERTLINLLKNLDYEKYEVDLLLLLKNGDLLNEIPQEVKVITPYSEIFSNFFAKESKISKIIKHLLFNKYTAHLWTNNKIYDVAINYSGYYLFIDYYIANIESNKKYIWVHQNVFGSEKHDKNFQRNFVKNIKKYNKYDKIVCVSDSAKDDFNVMFNQYKNKTMVINNILEDKINFTKQVSLKGKYKLVSVGRICPQKGLERLIKVHKILIDEGYDITTYLIGGGNDLEKLKQLAKENQIEDSFQFLGPKSNVYDYLRESDLFVSSTYYEAYPTVLFETMLCQIPWVCPNVPGVKDVYKVSPKGSCILTENNEESIAEGIKEAINGKVNKKFKLDIKTLNKKTLKDFYKLIGG